MDSRSGGCNGSMSAQQVDLNYENMNFSDLWGNSHSWAPLLLILPSYRNLWPQHTSFGLVLERVSKKCGSRASGFISQLRLLLEENRRTATSVMGEHLCAVRAQVCK